LLTFCSPFAHLLLTFSHYSAHVFSFCCSLSAHFSAHFLVRLDWGWFAGMDTKDMEELRRREGVEQVHWKVRTA
jgi:hypothetical protein